MPYICGNFVKEYVIPNYIGESLAALIPSVLSLSQGLGQNTVCYNVTIDNQTVLEPERIIPNFSVSVYFILMFILLCISTISFSLLHYSNVSRSVRKNKISDSNAVSSGKKEFFSQENGSDSSISADIANSNEVIIKTEAHMASIDQRNNRVEQFVLLSYIAMLSFTCYGVLPGLQSYSTLPYGNDIFNYSVNLSKLSYLKVVFYQI